MGNGNMKWNTHHGCEVYYVVYNEDENFNDSI